MIEYWDYQDADVVRWELAGLFSRKYGRNRRSVHFVKYMDGAAASKLQRNESDDFLPVGLFYHAGKVCLEAYLSKKGIEFWCKIDPQDDALIPMNLEFLPEENECKAYFAEIGVLDQLTDIIHSKITGRNLKSENTMKITKRQIRKIIRESMGDHSSHQAEELIEQVSYIMETGSRQDLISYLRSQDKETIKKAIAIAIEHGDKDLENTLRGELYARRMIADYSDNKNRLGRARYFGD